MCSSVYSRFSLPRGTSCTPEEVMLGRLVELAVAALREGRTLAPAEAYEFLEVLVAKSAAEVVLKHVVTEEVVGVDWDFCPLGFALERSAVFAGSLVGRAEEFYEPYSVILRHFGVVHVFAEAYTDEEREAAFRRYGAEAVVTCLRRPPLEAEDLRGLVRRPQPRGRGGGQGAGRPAPDGLDSHSAGHIRRMIIILRNAVAESSDSCLTLESEHGWWRLCIAERRASLELELSEAELPIDVDVPAHPNAALNVLFDIARSLADDSWAPGRLKVAVVGPPGSGKSTLVRRLLGLPPPAGPTRRPEVHRVVVLGREAEVVDTPGGASAEADCTVVVAPLDVYEEPPATQSKVVLVGSRADLGSEGLLELYAQAVKPVAAFALDLRKAPRWRLASVLASCV
jgi:hypothetical protein